MNEATTRPEGFQGQKLIRIPQSIKDAFREDPIFQQLSITDAGFYPPVSLHGLERPAGIPQNILIYCTDGEGWCACGGARHTIKKNNFFVIPAETPHAYGNRPDASWEIYWVHFEGLQSQLFAERLSGKKYGQANPLVYRRELLQLFHQMIADLENELSIEALRFANARLWHLLGDMVYHRRFALEGHRNIVDRAIAIMKERVEETLGLDELTNELGISTTYFCRLFKKRMELTPIDYFNRLKIQRACQYLDFTDMAIQEIANAIGYDDPFYFSRAFKRVMGVPPLRYRDKRQSRN